MIRAAISFSLTVVLVPLSVRAQDPVKTADSLVNKKQYNSAFRLLHNLSGSNANREVVLKKVDIAMSGFVTSIMHQLFAFKDLTADETIDDYRGKEGNYEMYYFPVDSVLTSLTQEHPEDGRLYRALADFYYDVLWKYGDQWLVPKDTVISRIRDNYIIASARGLKDCDLFHNLGVAYLQQEKTAEAIAALKKSVALNPKHASANYNLAYAYYLADSIHSAVRYAEAAFAMYEGRHLKADAAHLAGVSYNNLRKDSLAILYLLLADSLKPGDYYFTLHLLQASLSAHKSALADRTAAALFELGPENPTVSSNILESYYSSPLRSSLVPLFDKLASSHKQEPEVLGNIYFQVAKYHGYQKEKQAALEFLEKARTSFHACFPDTHYVFRVIDEQRRLLQGD